MRRSFREVAAYHEAGHAVAALAQGVKFKYVTVEPNAKDGTAGHVLLARKARPTLAAYFEHGIVGMAGEVAQRRFSPRSVQRHHGASDREDIVNMALSLSGDGQQATLFVKLWELKAKALIEVRWAQVEAVAQVLLERDRLTRQEVLQVAMAASRRRPEAA